MNKFLSKKITRVSFILACCVILLHATNTSTYTFSKYNPLKLLEDFFACIIGIAVPTFFIISGFLFYQNVNSLQTIKSKCKKRIFTLLIPYLIFNILYTIYFLFVYNVPGLKEHFNNSYRGTLTFDTISRGVLFAEFSGILWYVRNLLILTVLSPLIYYSLKVKPVSYAILIGLFTIFLFDLNITKLQYINFTSWGWYYFGAIIAFNKKPFPKLKNKYNILLLLLGIIFSLILFVLSNNFLDIITLNSKLINVICNILLTLMIFCFWFAFDLLVTEKTIKIEKLSFFIYCLHSLLLETIQKTFYILGGDKFIVSFIDYIVSPILTFGIIYILALFLNKFLPKLFKIVSGGRTLEKNYQSQEQNTSVQHNI